MLWPSRIPGDSMCGAAIDGIERSLFAFRCVPCALVIPQYDVDGKRFHLSPEQQITMVSQGRGELVVLMRNRA